MHGRVLHPEWRNNERERETERGSETEREREEKRKLGSILQIARSWAPPLNLEP